MWWWKMTSKRLLLLLPYALIAIMLMILPMIFLLIRAFEPAADNFDNWQIVKLPTMWLIMGRSILVGLLTAIICLLLGFPYAYIIARNKSKRFKIFAIALMISPLFVFTIIKVLALKGLLLALFSEDGLNNLATLVTGLAYLNLPFMIIPLYSVLNSMPDSLLEASEDLGFNHFRNIFKVVIPYSLKAIAAGYALVFMLAATSIIVSQKLIPKNESFKLIGNLLDNSRIQSKAPDAAIASTIALVTMVIMMLIYFVIYSSPFIIRKLRGKINV